ncbi:MAG: FAD-binding oxidoreductase [Spirochaetes bacterium]|nr:FAD-binding oxidoreductase [Spirochaetota bacterium]
MKKRNSPKTRNAVGWGYVEEAITAKEVAAVEANFGSLFSASSAQKAAPLSADSITLTPARAEIPAALANFVSASHHERLLHAVGRSFRDLAKLREASPLAAPDAVATPTSRDELLSALEWAARHNYAIIPFGGGSSVVGGVNPEGVDAYPATITVDMQSMNRVHAVSRNELVVHADAGILGPDLDAALKAHKMHTRYSPQSFHHSTLGGWIATRGAGHNSTVHQKIEDRVVSVAGILVDGKEFATRPLPATSVAIDPRSYWAGSEGMLGFITEARLRVYPLPEYRGFRAFGFSSFMHALDAARAIAQSEVFPVQLRILDEDENAQTARLAGVNPTNRALLILGDESTLPIVDARLDIVSRLATQCGGVRDENASRLLREWVRMFFRQPYLRDHLLQYNMIVDTFETAIGWDKSAAFYRAIKTITHDAVAQVCGKGHVGCRVTHAYSDGLCLYFSFYGPGRVGRLIEDWGRIKNAVSEAVVREGGTISHHHAMGRDHKPFAHKEFPEVHIRAIRDLKHSLDPKGLMNPGVWWS